jgi:hypothetical protein
MTGRQMRSGALVLAALLLAAEAAAQALPPPSQRSKDLSFGGTLTLPMDVGETSLNYKDTNGDEFTVFSATNRFGTGFGLDVNLGFRIARRLFAEGVGAWTHVPLEAKITGDVEAGEDATVSESASRFSLGGALRIHLTEGATEWFVRGGASWMREVAAGSALTGDGTLIDAGAGFFRTLTRRPGGMLKTGLRVEGRLSFRSGGLTLGEDKLRVGPVVTAALTLGFR